MADAVSNEVSDPIVESPEVDARRAWSFAQDMEAFDNLPAGLRIVRTETARAASVVFDEIWPAMDKPMPVVAVFSDDGQAQIRAPGSVLRELSVLVPEGSVEPRALAASDLEGSWSMDTTKTKVPNLAIGAALSAAVLIDARTRKGMQTPTIAQITAEGPWCDFIGDTPAQQAVSLAAHAYSAYPLAVFQRLGGDLAHEDRASDGAGRKGASSMLAFARQIGAPSEVVGAITKAVAQAHVRETTVSPPTADKVARARPGGDVR